MRADHAQGTRSVSVLGQCRGLKIVPQILLPRLPFLINTPSYSISYPCLVSGDEEESFWKVIKGKILDENVELIEMIIRDSKNTAKPILCRACQRPLDWFYEVQDEEINFDVVLYKCICIMSEPIFHMKISESSKVFLKLLDEKRLDPQLLAVSLNLVLIALYNMANPAPPLEPHNPIRTMAQILEEKSYMLRLGGKGSVIFAELYDNEEEIMVEGNKLIKSFPILYLADTMTIPTRFFLYPLRFKLNSVEGDYQNNLIEEMIVIANDVIKSGSNLILGSRLKVIITPDCYKSRAHNFATIVDIDSLSIAPRGDGDSSSEDENTPRPDHIWDEIMKPIITLCSGINVLVANVERVRTAEQHFEDMRQYLNAAIWLKTFNNTPFETFLYAILTSGMDNENSSRESSPGQ